MKAKFHRPWQAAWDKRNLKVFSTKLTARQAERVRAACDRIGITPYKLLQDYLLQWVRQQDQQQESPAHTTGEGFYIRW